MLRSKYYIGKAGSTLLMALPDHFHHGRIESYPENIWLYDEAHLLAYLKKLELDTAKFPGAMPVCGECVYRKTDKQQEQIQSIHEILWGNWQDICRGVCTVFLNTKGENRDEVPKELAALLDFVKADLAGIEADYEDPFVEQLQNSVRRIKKAEETIT